MAAKWEPTAERLELIRTLSMKGMLERDIAPLVDLHPNTFSEKKKVHPELAEALSGGRANGLEVAVTVVWETMINPQNKNQLRAALEYLRNFGGWGAEHQNPVPTKVSALSFTGVETPSETPKDDGN